MSMPPLEVRRVAGRWGIAESTAGLLCAALCMWLLVRWLTSGVYYDGHLALILSYAVVWVPLLVACAFACFIRGTGSPTRDFRLQFTWLDALFGIGIGLLARAVASLVEIAFYGRMNGLGVTLGDVVYDGWWVFGTILAPVLVAPFVEELFFRGLLQRSVLRQSQRMTTSAKATLISVLTSAVLFTALHLTEVTSTTAVLTLGISTLVFGLGSALLAALTDRTGGSMIAHMTFNGSLVLAVLLA